MSGGADLNVKVDDLLYRDFLLQQKGYLPGYHFARGKWVSVLLDGTVPLENILPLIDASYQTTVYMYVAAPVSAVLYQCTVTDTDQPCDFDNGKLTVRKLMRIRLERRYGVGEFTFERLKEAFGIYAVRGPRGIPNSLHEELNR